MKNLYLILAIGGFIAPNLLVIPYSIETGNWLFWLDPMATMEGMFPNQIASAFMIDLLWAVPVFFIWSWNEAKKLGIKNVWLYWVATMLFGVAGPLPLFLWKRETVLNS